MQEGPDSGRDLKITVMWGARAQTSVAVPVNSAKARDDESFARCMLGIERESSSFSSEYCTVHMTNNAKYCAG